MAGYSKIYCIGGQGGFLGGDGINPILLQILVGEGNRQWLEPIYFHRSLKPIGKIKVIVPQKPDDPVALLDACVAFAPNLFNKCPSLNIVKAELKNVNRLDFNLGEKDIPPAWFDLRKEAIPYFKNLNIFEAPLIKMDLEHYIDEIL